MTDFQLDIKSKISENLALSASDKREKILFYINGSFGTGKTRLIQDIRQTIINHNISDALITYNPKASLLYLSEFAGNFSYLYKSADSYQAFKPAETEYNLKDFTELLSTVKKSNSSLFSKIHNENSLKSTFDKNLYESNDGKKFDKSNINSKLEAIITKKGERRLILENQTVVAESMIVDLWVQFFGDNAAVFQDYNDSDFQPKKIIFIIDDFDAIYGSVFTWLINIFIPMITEKKFSDFISFNTDFINPEYKINQFFDCRFIIGTRENLNSEIDSINSLFEKYSHFALSNLNNNEVINYLNRSGIESTTSIEKIMNLTGGVPALVHEYSIAEKDNQYNHIIKKANELIFRFKNNQQIMWLKAAAFFDEFDSVSLKCFPEIAGNSKIAYKFIESCTDLSAYADTRINFIKLNQKIKFFIKENIKLDNETLYNEYVEHAASYSELKDFLSDLNEKELDTLRYLSFLSKFDSDFVKLNFDKKFKSNISASLFEKKDVLFDDFDGYYKLKDNVCTKIHKCNKFMFSEDLNSCNVAVHKMYDNYIEHLQKDIDKLENNKNIIDESIFSFNDDIANKKQEMKELQVDLMKDENYLIEVKRTLGDFSNTSYIKGFIINFIVFLVFMLIAAHSQTIIPIEEENSDKTIKIIFYVVAVIFGLVSFGYLTRIAIITSRNKEKSKVEKDIQDYETNRKEKQDYLQALKIEIDNDLAEVHKLKGEKNSLDKEIEKHYKYLKTMQ